MTVLEFNKTIAREKLQLPDDLEVVIVAHKDDEVQIKVNDKLIWIKKKKPKRGYVPRKELVNLGTPEYTLPKAEIELGPGPFMLLQWIRSLSNPKFTVAYAANELGMSSKSVQAHMRRLKWSGFLK